MGIVQNYGHLGKAINGSVQTLITLNEKIFHGLLLHQPTLN